MRYNKIHLYKLKAVAHETYFENTKDTMKCIRIQFSCRKKQELSKWKSEKE